jgi:hypothetical protein
MKDNVYLVATSAFMVAGDMILAGDVVEVSDSEARDLLSRGKARVATAEDGAPQDDDGEAEPDADPAEQLEAVLLPAAAPTKKKK